jgi:hypothetical protein
MRLIRGHRQDPLAAQRGLHRGGRSQRRLADPTLADEEADPGPGG